MNIKIPISLWRHIITWFLNYHSVQFHEHHRLLNRSGLASQSGHSEDIHSLYAADVRLPAGIDFHAFFETMRTSGIWHRLVQFSHFLQRSLLEDMACMPSQIDDGTLPRISLSAEGHSSSSFSAADIVEEVKKSLLPSIMQTISQSRANDLACLLSGMGMNPQSPPSLALTQPVTHIMHPSRLRDLRTFLRNGSASFRDPQQALALELIRGKEPSLLVIGPTSMEYFYVLEVVSSVGRQVCG